MRRLPGPRTLLPAARALLPTRTGAAPHLPSPRTGAPVAVPAPPPDLAPAVAPAAAPPAANAAASPGATAADGVAALTAWTDLTWARTPDWCASAADGLDPTQRLLLGIVAFGPVRYRTAALGTGLAPAEVSGHCAAALRHLSAARSPVR